MEKSTRTVLITDTITVRKVGALTVLEADWSAIFTFALNGALNEEAPFAVWIPLNFAILGGNPNITDQANIIINVSRHGRYHGRQNEEEGFHRQQHPAKKDKLSGYRSSSGTRLFLGATHVNISNSNH